MAGESLGWIDFEATTAAGADSGTWFAGSSRGGTAFGNPAVWLSESVQNCHFGVKYHQELAGEKQSELDRLRAMVGRSAEQICGANPASNCWNSGVHAGEL